MDITTNTDCNDYHEKIEEENYVIKYEQRKKLIERKFDSIICSTKSFRRKLKGFLGNVGKRNAINGQTNVIDKSTKINDELSNKGSLEIISLSDS